MTRHPDRQSIRSTPIFPGSGIQGPGRSGRRGLVGLVLGAMAAAALFGALPGGSAWAQQAAAPEPHTVTGFRSARFGDKEPAVRAAIAKDFDKSGDAVEVVENPIESTKALKVEVEDLLPGSGTAAVTYILGFRSQALVQVNVVWGPPVDPEADPGTVVNTANQLRGYFLGLGFNPEQVLTNQQLPTGSVLVFRGTDPEGRLVALQLNPLRGPTPDGAEPASPRMSLVLSYVADPANPDVFKIEKGAF